MQKVEMGDWKEMPRNLQRWLQLQLHNIPLMAFSLWDNGLSEVKIPTGAEIDGENQKNGGGGGGRGRLRCSENHFPHIAFNRHE